MLKKTISLFMAGLTLLSCSDNDEKQKNIINIYSSRLPELIQPIINAYKKDKDLDMNIIYLGKGVIERLKQEKSLTKSDVIIMSDIGKLLDLKKENLTLAINDTDINNKIPAQYRDSDGHWFGLTRRIRMIAYANQRVIPDTIRGYSAFADPLFNKRVCSRSGVHPYNISMISAFEIDHGTDKTDLWLEGFKANLALPPSGGDRDQMKLIAANKCDIAPVNHYYYGKMKTDPNYKDVLEKVSLLPIEKMDGGAYANISGVMVSKYTKNKAAAIDFIQFMAGQKGQEIFNKVDFEIPINQNVAINKDIIGGDNQHIKAIPLSSIAEKRLDTYKKVYRIGFDD